MATNTARSFNALIGETSNVRYVDGQFELLEPDRTPLYVLTSKSKRKEACYAPRIEWFEDQDIGMIGTVSNGTTNYASNATQVFVQDVTLYGVNDVVQVAKAASSSTVEELILVTAVSGTTTGTLTITRAFAGTTADTITATNVLKTIGVAQTENGSIDNPRASVASPKTSGCQIFEWPIQVTRTGAASKSYTNPKGERAKQQMMGLRRQKIEIENAGLFGSFSESLASPGSRWTSQGLKSIITSNLTDGGNTLTLSTFLTFSQNVFRYNSGATEKLLVACPTIKTALDYFSVNKALTHPEDKVFGVSLTRFVTSNGTFMIANNYNMDGGNNDEALVIDLPAVSFCYLDNNGISMDTHIVEDYDTTNPKLIKDLVLTQGGWRIKYQARHGRLYDVAAFS